jgi:exodeoxyribonuclease VII large subunit
MSDTIQHHSLLDVLQSVQRMFERYWKKPIWIKSEIAKVNLYPHSGHAYPLLMEKREGKTVAEIRSIVWATDFRRIKTKFETITKKEFTDGIEVLIFVEVNFTPAHGISLKILDVDPTFTLGAMELERQKTIEKLKSEKLFDRNKQVLFPVLPKRIAIISVETSKGYHDFVETLENNSKQYKVDYELFPALLQGDKAVESIRIQLDIVRQRRNEFDVLAIIRGGGGEVGLSCYDNFSLSSAVAQFPLPIITGIGHATNLTVVEMVSFQNLITPTALANFILEKFEDFDSRLKSAENELAFYTEKIIKDSFIKLQSLSNIFETDVKLLLQSERHLLGNFVKSLKLASVGITKSHSKRVDDLSVNIKYLTKNKIQEDKFNLNSLSELLKNVTATYSKHENQRIEINENKIKLLNPDNILKRGYSITRINGSTKGISNLKKGDTIEIETFDKKIESTVSKTSKK